MEIKRYTEEKRKVDNVTVQEYNLEATTITIPYEL